MKGLRSYNPTNFFNEGLLGQYAIGASTGLVAAGTTGEIYQFRWQDSIRFAAIRKVTLHVAVATAFAAPASPLQFDIIRAGGWTGQGTGGTALDTTTGSGKRRSQMPSSLLLAGDLRIATTAALGAGMKTLDALALATEDVPFTGTVGFSRLLDFQSGDMDYPLVLATTEGFAVRILTNPGTGTLVASVSTEWVEVDAR